jgi:hypothetical protein
MDAANETGSRKAFCTLGSNAIEPGSGPRNKSLKTRMGKKELAAIANCRLSKFCEAGLIPFNRLRSRFIVTVPFSTIIF